MAEFGQSSGATSNRRDFVRAGLGLGAAGVAAFGAIDQLLAEGVTASAKPVIKPGDVVLFQGDSITDAGRKRGIDEPNNEAALGTGYAWLAASQMLVDLPEAGLKIFNRGVSGNKVYQLAERWQSDCLDLKPKVLSILIGVNDYWHKHKHNYEGTLEKYEGDYRALIKRTTEALPDVRLILCEPFTLKFGSVDDTWFPEFDGYREAAKRVAKDVGAVFVQFHTMFDAAVKVAPPGTWAADGVHPTPSGAALMAHWWLKAVGA